MSSSRGTFFNCHALHRILAKVMTEEEGGAVRAKAGGRVETEEEEQKSMLLCTDVQCTTLIRCHVSHAVFEHFLCSLFKVAGTNTR